MWLLGDSAAYIHSPKTGGTFVSACLRDKAGAKLVHGQHDPSWLYPDEVKGRTVYSNVREPFSWYVSLYVHAMNADATIRGRLEKFGGGSTDFHRVLYGWTHPAEVEDMPSHVGAIWEPAKGLHESLPKSGHGLWGWTVRYMAGEKSMCEAGTGGWVTSSLLNTAHLSAALPRLFGVSTDGRPRMNTREQRQGRYQGPPVYTDWLTPNAYRWIEQSDGDLIQFFGFTIGDGGASAPAWWGMP